MSRRANPYRQELKIALNQRKRQNTMINKLTDITVEWDGLSGGLESDFSMLVKEVGKHLDVPDQQIADRAKGYGDSREVA
jgi:hypothetical protein